MVLEAISVSVPVWSAPVVSTKGHLLQVAPDLVVPPVPPALLPAVVVAAAHPGVLPLRRRAVGRVKHAAPVYSGSNL